MAVPNRQSDRFVVNPVDALRDLAQCLAHRTHLVAVIWRYYWAKGYHGAVLTGPLAEEETAPKRRRPGVVLSVVLSALLILAGETAK